MNNTQKKYISIIRITLFIFFPLATATQEAPQKKYTLCVTAVFQNESSRIKEWIEYHRMVGVDHFLLYNNNSSDNWEPIVLPYVQEGIVEIVDWPTINNYGWPTMQINAYKDALTKTNGIAEWLALIDLDEFLFPKNEKTIPECLKKNFPTASGIYVNWRHFGTNHVYFKEGDSLLFKLIACSRKGFPTNIIGKSIVRPDAVKLDAVWYIHHYPLKNNHTYYNGDNQPLTFNANNDLLLDAKVHEKFIRINHYRMGDEQYFRTIRLARQIAREFGIDLLWEHYHAYNEKKDPSIAYFIKHKHPESYQKHWKDGLFS